MSDDRTAPASSGTTASDKSDHQTPSNTRRPWLWKAAVPVVTLVAGSVFGVSALTSHGTDLRSGETDLADVVTKADQRVKAKQTKVASARRNVEREKLKATNSSHQKQLNAINAKINHAQPDAGLSEITGPSITVTLNDSSMPVDQLPEDGTPDWLVVHQQDVQAVVNALWRGGARGMMLMDQRVVSTSAVRCVGNTLILQGRVYSPPFTIKAIGDPVKMQAALDNDESVSIYRQYVDLVGLGYQVSTKEQDTFPAFTGSVTMKHAKVQR